MCRLILYLGKEIGLDLLLEKPEHSLVVQSYRPLEMESGTVNADGFGIGWYHPEAEAKPSIYKNTIPIWNDINLQHLSKQISSHCIFANVRSATPGIPVNQSNCQPFAYKKFMFMHNGLIENFRYSMMRQIRGSLCDEYYTSINGTTDSEHIFALFLNHLHGANTTLSNIVEALRNTIYQLNDWASKKELKLLLNLAVTDGENIIASKFSNRGRAPSLYYIKGDEFFRDSVVIASERLYSSPCWEAIPEGSIVSVTKNLDVKIDQM